MSDERGADAVERLADAVERLTVDRHDPERFFEDRSEIVFRLREEARRLRRGRTPSVKHVVVAAKRKP